MGARKVGEIRPIMKLGKLATVLIGGLFVAGITTAAALVPLAVLTVIDDNASGYPGDTGIGVPVSLSSQGGAEVSIVNFDLNYDTDRLTVAGVAIGSAASAAERPSTYRFHLRGCSGCLFLTFP